MRIFKIEISKINKMILKHICLSVIFALISAYDVQRKQTFNQNYIAPNTDDTLVRVSSNLVGFWYQNANDLCIHIKTDFLQGLSSKANCYTATTKIKSLQSTNNNIYAVLEPNSISYAFIVGKFSLLNSQIDIKVLYQQPYNIYEKILFSDNYLTGILQNGNGGYIHLIEDTSSAGYTKSRQINKPNEIAFEEIGNENFMFYTSTTNNGNNIVTYELINKNMDILTPNFINVGDNCANSLTVTDKLLIVVCTTTTPRILSVYRKSDMKLMFKKNDDSTMLATTVRALSTDFYYQIIYNSYSSTPDNGTLTIVDILPNNKNPNLFTNIVRKNEIYDDNSNKYGLFFDVDSDGMAYISAHSNNSTTILNPINVMRLCTHNQKYDSSTKTCVSTSTSSITFGLQDTSEVACSNVDDSIEYNRNVAESVCNYNCADGQIGKKCESCDNYLTRLKKYFQMYQKNYYNPVDKTCSIVDDAEYCSKHTRCIECFSVKGCVYSNNLCTKGAAYNKTFNPLDYISQCPKNEEPNDTTLCSKSQRDLDTMDFTKLMPQTIKPNGTVCVYNITSSKKIYRDLTFTIDKNANLIITQSINGVMKTVEPKSTRNLDSFGRMLTPVTQTFSITGADSISMSYMSSGDSAALVSVLGSDQTPVSELLFILR